ncbi:MAG: hypothetical protein J2O49_01650 [Sciscionella sp.]|nr:hypothetical protein [Sciscionella sp.]
MSFVLRAAAAADIVAPPSPPAPGVASTRQAMAGGKESTMGMFDEIKDKAEEMIGGQGGQGGQGQGGDSGGVGGLVNEAENLMGQGGQGGGGVGGLVNEAENLMGDNNNG